MYREVGLTCPLVGSASKKGSDLWGLLGSLLPLPFCCVGSVLVCFPPCWLLKWLLWPFGHLGAANTKPTVIAICQWSRCPCPLQSLHPIPAWSSSWRACGNQRHSCPSVSLYQGPNSALAGCDHVRTSRPSLSRTLYGHLRFPCPAHTGPSALTPCPHLPGKFQLFL